MFSTHCTVQADLSQMTKAMKLQRGRGGVQFYKQDFSIVLLLGLTELKAHISWMDNVCALNSYVTALKLTNFAPG